VSKESRRRKRPDTVEQSSNPWVITEPSLEGKGMGEMLLDFTEKGYLASETMRARLFEHPQG